MRAYAAEPVLAVADSSAANAPELIVVLCTKADPSPLGTTVLHAEKSPLSKPSEKRLVTIGVAVGVSEGGGVAVGGSGVKVDVGVAVGPTWVAVAVGWTSVAVAVGGTVVEVAVG